MQTAKNDEAPRKR